MKHLILAATLFPSLLFAQIPQSPPRQPRPPSPTATFQTPADTLPDNYQVTLTIADKDAPPAEVSIVVASTNFSASLGEPALNFSGTVAVEDSGAIVISYTLGWTTTIAVGNNTQQNTSGTQGSVRLKVGEEVQIIRAGTRTARLSIKKLEAGKAK